MCRHHVFALHRPLERRQGTPLLVDCGEPADEGAAHRAATVLYLGEINDSQKEQWIRAIEVFDEDQRQIERLKLFAADRALPEAAPEGVQVRLRQFSLNRPRQWDGCWLFTLLWKQLGLEEFWRGRLGVSREGTDWEHVLAVLCCYRLLEPGSEWRLHRVWFDQCAMGDLLAEDFAVAAKDTLYRCLDHLVAHKQALFGFLRERWNDFFGVSFDVLLYDLTSTYFESDTPLPTNPKAPACPTRIGTAAPKPSTHHLSTPFGVTRPKPRVVKT